MPVSGISGTKSIMKDKILIIGMLAALVLGVGYLLQEARQTIKHIDENGGLRVITERIWEGKNE